MNCDLIHSYMETTCKASSQVASKMKYPDDWKVYTLNKLVAQTQYGTNQAVSTDGLIPIIGMKEIQNGKVLTAAQKVSLPPSEQEKYRLDDGDILLNRTNSLDLVGKSGVYHQNTIAVFASYLIRLKPVKSLADSDYLGYYLNSYPAYITLKKIATAAISQANINPTELKRLMVIPCPPLLEQQQIAEFLGTWDEAIEKLERLIEAKEKRLSWIRANILTGKVRINGFSSKWKQIIFLEIASRVTRSVGKARVAPVSISAGKGFVLQEEKFGRNIAGKQYSKYTLLFPEEFTYNKGNSKTYECGCVYQWRGKAPVAVPNVFVSFSLNVKLADARFISHFFEADLHANELRKFINSGVRNDGLLNVTPDCFFKIILSLPELPEQKAIANILDTTSQEIDILRAELIMFQKQKRGLMQKLLTGVWRI